MKWGYIYKYKGLKEFFFLKNIMVVIQEMVMYSYSSCSNCYFLKLNVKMKLYLVQKKSTNKVIDIMEEFAFSFFAPNKRLQWQLPYSYLFLHQIKLCWCITVMKFCPTITPNLQYWFNMSHSKIVQRNEVFEGCCYIVWYIVSL